MTRRKNRKRLARERAAKTGESYVTALRIIGSRAQEDRMTTPQPQGPAQAERLTASLVSRELLSMQALDAALEAQRRTGKSLGRTLLDHGLVDEADLMSAIADEIGIEFVDLDHHQVDAAASALVSDAIVSHYAALPIGWEEGRLVVAIADPGNLFAIDHIKTITRSEVKVVLATRDAILNALEGPGSGGRAPT